jgi:NAD+ diphosphatase
MNNYLSTDLIFLVMLRESIYKRYDPDVNHNYENSPAYWFIYNSDKLLINPKNENKIPFIEDIEVLDISPVCTHYIGTLEAHPCICAEVPSETIELDGMMFKDLRSLYEILDEDLFLLAGRAIQIINWDKNHKYCGKCGTLTLDMDDEMAKICPKCGYTSYTRISPAVITAIVKNGKLLMAKHSYGLKDRYALIAGFVEAGETLEEGVKREIMEEVGLKVNNIKYFGSQSWPFPHSLMIGFTADYLSGKINVDGKEIVDARWFDVDEITPMPSNISISSELVEWYVKKFKSI